MIMNRTKSSLVVLLLLSLSFQPCVSQTKQDIAKIEAEVAKMSEAEMRARLQGAKQENERAAKAMKANNYKNDLGGGILAANDKASFEYSKAWIYVIEKRLRIIDSEREKEPEQQQQEQQKSNPDEQRQMEFQQSVNEKIESSNARYGGYHAVADASTNAAREGNVALDIVTSNKDPNFKPISQDMLNQQQQSKSSAANSNANISDKFKNKKIEESKTKGLQKKNEDNVLKNLLEEMQNDLNSLK